MLSWSAVYRLGLKELISLSYDRVMLVLILYTFTFAVYSVATGASTEVRNAATAVLDQDRSALSRQLQAVILPPYFRPPHTLSSPVELELALDQGRYTFILEVPPNFAADFYAGRQPQLALHVDASAMSQAGIGAGYLERILSRELYSAAGISAPTPLKLVNRVQFNPNLNTVWFMGVMQLVNNVTLLAIILTGAALIREREHGTLEHLLVLPLRPSEIMLAKVWANALVIVLAATASLYAVVQGLLQMPIRGSVPLFIGCTVVYLAAVTALGILLATLARSMPQFGLLAIPVFIMMNLLSGTTTPLDSMPLVLQYGMQLMPSTHYVALAQSVLYRGADLSIIWPQLLAVIASGSVFFLWALQRFCNTISAQV